MYFITKQNPNTFLLGIYENNVYAYGCKNGKLIIYHKCIFDAGEMEEFWNTGLQVRSCTQSCCKCLPVAGGIFDTKIWMIFAAEKNCNTTIFGLSLDCLSKEYFLYPILQSNSLPLESLKKWCNKIHGYTITEYNLINGRHELFIKPIRVKNKDEIIVTYKFTIDEKLKQGRLGSCSHLWVYSNSLSNIIFGKEKQIFYVNEKNEGLITQLNMRYFEDKNIILPNTCTDIAFYQGNDGETRYLSRSKICDDKINIVSTKILHNGNSVSLEKQFCIEVDKNFPYFSITQINFSSNFIAFSTSEGIVTIITRMLTLSEISYVSLIRSQKQMKKKAWYQKITKNFQSRKSSKEPWMSFKFIKNALNLPDSFSLIHP